ncbi:MAG: chemotaxis protein CheW [FCB group bacterium]|nr:chemotaxis protein CheW [FCB group bacterium]
MKKKSIKELLDEKKSALNSPGASGAVGKSMASGTKPNTAGIKIIDQNDAGPVKYIHLISFKIDKFYFGINILQIQEVVKPHDITRVPHLDASVLGIMNLRGTITPVIDLRTRLDLPNIPFSDKTRIIIVKVKDQMVGITVDSVAEIIGMPEKDIETAPDAISGIDAKYIIGIAKQSRTSDNETGMVVVLDPEKIMYKKAGVSIN